MREDNKIGGGCCFGLNKSQARLCTAIVRHTVLVMAALAICAAIAALIRRRTDTRSPAPHQANRFPLADPGMIPLTVPETARLLAHPPPSAPPPPVLSAWYHQRT
jgi:hypothetical protein